MATFSGYPDQLAGGITQEEGYAPFHLFAGEDQPVSNQINAGPVALEQFRTYAYDADNKAVPYDPAAGAPVNKLIGCAAQPIPANGQGPGFEKGVFNHAALIWPAAVNTVELRKAACHGSPFQVRKLL